MQVSGFHLLSLYFNDLLDQTIKYLTKYTFLPFICGYFLNQTYGISKPGISLRMCVNSVRSDHHFLDLGCLCLKVLSPLPKPTIQVSDRLCKVTF